MHSRSFEVVLGNVTIGDLTERKQGLDDEDLA